MTEQRTPAPLAHTRGERPPAPAWFDAALRQFPERSFVTVQGARIEMLTWGERGEPGILLMHGNAAHADWWSFVAPLLTPEYRVAAMSWSGMGGSDWREAYAIDLCAEEAMTVAQAAGLFDADVKPVFVGHSFGGAPTIACAARFGERLRAAIALDTPIWSPEMRKAREGRRGPPREPKAHNVYPTLEAALLRFRFLPAQPVANDFIAHHIARASLRRAPLPNGGGEGWTWRFDPFLWKKFRRGDTAADLKSARCPVALMWGERSQLFGPEVLAYMRSLVPAGSPLIAVPDADHHVMVDQPLGLVVALQTLLANWPPSPPQG